ncbi:hypothetical protein NKL07_15130 [Mesorhizobium sp. C280B]|uniref:hypothetical protein n=1 Tax=unclassified Mesorhizobium TaxID=325217 RepID=UPI0003CF54AD|nr:hypothetical protein [Mesorhizobium sp. LSJC280B00]ESW94005.1 hypothetical protein X772_00565 [Mesorhizobium sp. LSJC280B00]
MLSMRILGALGLAFMAGTAQASSLVFLGQTTATPSVVGTVASPGSLERTKTPSIVALGEKLPNVNENVTEEKVAAIPSQPSHGFAGSPMIIRGGIVGDAFATPAPKAAPATAAAPAADGKADPKVASNPPEPAAPQPAPLAAPDQPK